MPNTSDEERQKKQKSRKFKMVKKERRTGEIRIKLDYLNSIVEKNGESSNENIFRAKF